MREMRDFQLLFARRYSSLWLCPGVGGGEKKGKRKRGGEKRRRGEKEKKLIVYRYVCLRVYLYAI